jgi:hypothetical protein
MSTLHERNALAEILLDTVKELVDALEPFGQTLLAMEPEAWPADAVAVRVAYGRFELARKAATAVGHRLTLEQIAVEFELVEAYWRNGGPVRLGPPPPG